MAARCIGGPAGGAAPTRPRRRSGRNRSSPGAIDRAAPPRQPGASRPSRARALPAADPAPDRARSGDAVLLYEDDDALAAEIALAFAAEGWTIERVADEAALRLRLDGQAAAALILDRLVAGRDSLALLAERRAAGDRTPVVVISSLDAVDDRIRGLKAGGDDYLVKPFATGELLARVAALRRRAMPASGSVLRAGPLRMDLIERRVTRDGHDVPLLPREFALLHYLMRHAGTVVTRAMLLEDVWRVRASTRTNVVDVHVGNLRRKIEAAGGARLIESVRGSGFVLAGEDGGGP